MVEQPTTETGSSHARVLIRARLAAYHETQRREADARRRDLILAQQQYVRAHWQRWSPAWRERFEVAIAEGGLLTELMADAWSDCPPVEVA